MPSKFSFSIFSKTFIAVFFTTSSLVAQDSILIGSDTVLFSIPGSYIYIPCVTTTATVQAWGGGGGGASSAWSGGGGGGGGGYSCSIVTLIAGTTYTLTVGAGGIEDFGWQNSHHGQNGGPSSFDATVLANGGGGAIDSIGGVGGAAGIGNIISVPGGDGGNGGIYNSVHNSNGGDSGNPAGGNTGTGGGVDSLNAGGGGGGAFGLGGQVLIILSSAFVPPPSVNASVNNTPQAIYAGNIPSTLTVTATGGGGSPYSYQWLSSTTNATIGFSPVAGATAYSYSPGPVNVSTWYKAIASVSYCNRDTSAALPITVISTKDTVLFSTPGSYTYIPQCTTTATIQAWAGGGGGAGGGGWNSGTGGGAGGGGGGYSSSVVPLIPGTAYNITVGAGGSGGSSDGGNGGSSSFDVTVLANGGKGAVMDGTGGTGGAAGTGNIVSYPGGNGGAGSASGNGTDGTNGSGFSSGGGGGGASGNYSAGGSPADGGNGNIGGVGGIAAGTTTGGAGAGIGAGGGGGSTTIYSGNAYTGTGGTGAGGQVLILLPFVSASVTNTPQTVYAGSTPSTLTVTATGGGAAYSYQWLSSTTDAITGFSPIIGATSYTYSPGPVFVSIWYKAIASISLCTIDTSDALPITVIPSPPVSVGASVTNTPQTICAGSTPVTFTVIASGSGGAAYSYIWQSSTTNATTGFSAAIGANSYTYSPGPVSLSTWYRAIVSAMGYTSDTSAALPVTVQTVLNVGFTSTVICVNNSTILTAAGADTYTWSPGGATTNTLSVGPLTTTTVYTVAGTQGTCTGTGSGTVTVAPDATITLISPPASTHQNVCVNTPINAITYSVGGATGAGVMTLLPAGVTGNFSGTSIYTISGTPTAAGTFAYTVTTTGGCTQPITTGTLVINPLPVANPGTISTMCENDSVTITGATGSNYSTIVWTSNGLGTLTNTNTLSPQYKVSSTDQGKSIILTMTVTGTNTCASVTTATTTVVNVRPALTATLNAQQSVCPNATAQVLFRVTSPATPPYTFTYTQDGVQPPPVTSTNTTATISTLTTTPKKTVYNLINIKDAHCTKSLNLTPQTLTVDSLPTATISSKYEGVCRDSLPKPIVVKGRNGTPPYTFKLTLNNDTLPLKGHDSTVTTPPTDKTGALTYVLLSITDNKGCSQALRDTATVTVNENPNALFTISPERTTILRPEITITDASIAATKWMWDFGDGQFSSSPKPKTHTYTDTGTYKIKLLLSNGGCTVSTYQIARINLPLSFYVPNSFTVNGDGVNDLFKAEGDGITKFEMIIYDRKNQVLFHSNDINTGWDGKTKEGDELAEIGAYVYVINLRALADKHDYTYRGVVNLIR